MFSTTNDFSLPDLYMKSNISEKLDAYQVAKYNRKKYNDFVKNSRQERASKGNIRIMKAQMKDIDDKIKNYHPKLTKNKKIKEPKEGDEEKEVKDSEVYNRISKRLNTESSNKVKLLVDIVKADNSKLLDDFISTLSIIPKCFI